LLTHLLSLRAEYRKVEEAPEMKFFSLEKNEDSMNIESVDNLTKLDINPILDEYAAYFDLEQEYSKRLFDSKIK